MNKHLKFLSVSLCGLALAFSLPFASTHAATMSFSNTTDQYTITFNPQGPSTFSGTGIQQYSPVLSEPDTHSGITSWLTKGTRFIILICPGNGWYYGAWGDNYNGWHYGWIPSEDISINH